MNEPSLRSQLRETKEIVSELLNELENKKTGGIIVDKSFDYLTRMKELLDDFDKGLVKFVDWVNEKALSYFISSINIHLVIALSILRDYGVTYSVFENVVFSYVLFNQIVSYDEEKILELSLK